MAESILSKFIENENALSIDRYLANGGYEAARKVVISMTPDRIVQEVKQSDLRGLGGAGFGTGMKWGFIPKNSGKPVYLAVNADEGEPGTFKDRYIMERVPHLMLEGMIICCYAVGCHRAYIYVRGEYDKSIERLEKAIFEAREKGFLGTQIFGKPFDLDIVIHRGAGAYICGEETALLESLEGKKGFPRLKPPFPAVSGLWGCPTVINNVETLSYLPSIILKGGAWFAALGSAKNGGLRLFGVSGHVKKPGLYELPLGTPLRSIIYDSAGGIRNGNRLKAVVPGGLSAAVLTADEIDIPMDFDSLKVKGSMLGSAGVMVMDETVCMVRALYITMRFFAHESCGQCSPCREGTGWMEKVVGRVLAGKGRTEDLKSIAETAKYLTGTTICALADGAAMPLGSYVEKFYSEFEHHVRHGACDLKPELVT
ncbi:MAG: NADH-quinone oxidoreductase subunit NuoF [Candidatus Omnitrophica bacterium]|nr:NADH-quinone oxidoreductase subunit NuoF [Candidatus Omnitrophota bacterium]